MKKIFVLLVGVCLLMCGCGSYDQDKALKDFKNLVDNNRSYYLEGNMSIVSGEKNYSYDVNVSYKEGSYYKVNLLNTDNSHEQIILKNDEGVYVITPDLNKSFKFQSDWPNNSSQAYILETILDDIEKDGNRAFEEKDGKYIMTSSVNYPNNSNFKTQKVTFNKKMEPEKVEILSDNGTTGITMNFTKIEWSKKFEKDYFSLNSNIKEDCCSETKETGNIEDIIYPMYIPVGTKFQNQEVVKSDNSERVILTFEGEKPFILVEEVSSASKEFEVTSATGDLVFYETILGALTDTSVSWSNGGRDYYIIGQNLSNEELLQIASSTASVAVVK